MKKITFLLIFFSVLFQANSQVTIGSGNLEIENAPFEPFFGYSYTQTVYLASEINASGTITDIQWYYSGTTALPNSQGLVIYMAESNRAAYASTTDWEPIASFTQVYSGGITVTAGVAGWVQITLDTPFVYNGTGNLIIAVEENTAGFDASSDDFHNSQVTTNRTISHFSDTVNADPAAPPTASNIDDTIPNVILGGISQACPNPTNVTGAVTVTTVNLDWDAGTGSNWEFINQLVGEPAPTDTDSGSPIATNFVEIMNLIEGSNYEFYVRADCGVNGFSSWVGPFLYRISGPGETCENPIVVSNPLPYSTDDNTNNYGDDYSGGPGANCGSTSGYLGGDDVVYSYTPTSDTTITITLTPGGTWSGLFVYDECADIGVNCLAGVANSSSNVREIELAVTAGNTYYIVVSTWPAPQNIPYNLTITENTCTDAVATYTVRQDCLNGPQFFVDVDLTDLGSATDITITDNQGSTPETTTATGMFTFGPFANGTGVVITVTNDDDSNCTLTSTSLTQDQCVLNQVDCSAGPLNINYCYGDNDDTAWLFQSTDGSPLRITFNAGGIESCCDDILIYDGVDNTAPLIYVGNNGGNLAGLQFDSSGDSLFMEIDADGSVSCQANSFCCTTEWDFTVSCATCVNPVVDYVVRQDCLNGPQFFVDVDLTDLGSATSITLTDNQGSTPQTTAVTGLFSFGPFVNNTDVVITVANDDDANCTLTSASLTQDQCVLNIVDCAVGPLNFNYCYGDNDDATWLFQSSDGSPVRLTFNAGGIESCCDDILIYEGTDNTGTLIYVGNNGGNLAGLQFDSIGDSLFMEIDADGSVSCQANSFCCSTEWDFTVTCATCVNPAATYTVVDDCDNGDQFLIDVNITSLGDASSLTISNNIDANTVPVTAVGTYQVGPFPFLQNVIITTSNDQDVNCVINSSPIQLLACPPDNDNCDGAIVASVNDNDSCDLTTPGTIIAATPSGVPDGCAGDPDDDVWFQFTALNEVQLISITNITGGTTNLDHAVYSGACGTLTELYCSPNTASITPELVVGNTYYIRIFSFGSIDETSSFDLCIKKAPENTICENASSFCGEGGALYGSNVIGIPDNTSVACLGTIPNPSWNIIQIGESGPINIQMVQNTSFDDDGNPTGQGLDVDFVIWGPFDSETDYCALDLLVDCPTCPFSNVPDNGFYPFGNIIDCSYSGAAVENLTIDNAIEGEIYVLLITNFSNNPGIIQIQQTNAGGDGAGAITSEIEVNLGEDQNLCGFTEFELVADSPFADRYEWYEDGFLMEDETNSTLTVTQSNIYTVIAYDDNCEAVAQDEITVNFYLEPTANPVADIVTCDDASADNIENFDLEAQTEGVLGAQNPADFAVTYHLTLADAQNGVGALTSPYNNISNPQTIYVRVEDVDAVGSSSGCFATTSFDLIISGPTPTATSVDMELCDDISRDGFESFTLTDNNANILDGQDDTQFIVSYYASEADANAGINPLTSPYTNLSNPQTIWARVESNVAFDCYSVVDFDLIVLDVPFATFNSDVVDYEVCPNATVPIEITLIPNGYTEADVTVQWTLDNGVIPNQNGLTLPVLVEGVYEATITFNGTQCSYIVSETVIELESCIIPQGISPNNDGLNDRFDVSSYDVSRLEIFNRNGTLVYSKTNYTDEWFGQTNDGEELPVGTYFYSMIYQGGKEATGWVYINR
jgi:gliding motility-associated-like protein